jgi:hypothetical protein
VRNLWIATMKMKRRCYTGAFSLVEILIASALGMITIGASFYGYIVSANRAEWSAYSLAANSIAMQRMEQARACRWDPLQSPPVDELVSTNFPVQISVLDIPISGTNTVYATNYTTIRTIQTDPPLKMIRVDCCWMFVKRGPFTNTLATYRSPDQ